MDKPSANKLLNRFKIERLINITIHSAHRCAVRHIAFFLSHEIHPIKKCKELLARPAKEHMARASLWLKIFCIFKNKTLYDIDMIL
jgi:hypothetical protein